MADNLDQLHIDAAPALLRLDTGPPALVVYPDAEGNTPTIPAEKYVRVYAYIERPPDAAGNALIGLSSTWTTYWHVVVVGPNEYSVTALGMRARVALLDKRPTIAGRNCGLIRSRGSSPPARSNTTGPAVFERTDIYSMTSTG